MAACPGDTAEQNNTRQTTEADGGGADRKPSPPPPVDIRQVHRSADTELHRLGPGHPKEAHLTRLLQIYEQSVAHRAEASLWDDNLWKMVQMEPQAGTLWISRCEGAQRVNQYAPNNLYVRVLWNKKVVGQTSLAAAADGPVWDEGFAIPRIFTRHEVINRLVLQLFHSHMSVLGHKSRRDVDVEDGDAMETKSPPVLIAELEVQGRGTDGLPIGRKLSLPLPIVDFGDSRKKPTKPKRGTLTISFDLHTQVSPTAGVTPRRANRALARARAIELAAATGKIEALNELRSRRLDLSFCEVANCNLDIEAVTKKYSIPKWICPGSLTAENNPRPEGFHFESGIGKMRKLMFNAKDKVSHRSLRVEMPESGSGRVHFDVDINAKDSAHDCARKEVSRHKLKHRWVALPVTTGPAFYGMHRSLSVRLPCLCPRHRKVQTAALHATDGSPTEGRRKGRMPHLPTQRVKTRQPLQVAFGVGTSTGSFSAREHRSSPEHTRSQALPPIGKNGLMPTVPRGGGGGLSLNGGRTMYDTLGCLSWRKTHSQQQTASATGAAGEPAKPRAWVIDAVNLANNKLEHLDGLGIALCPFLVFHNCSTLQILDLSCNRLTRLWNKPVVATNLSLDISGMSAGAPPAVISKYDSQPDGLEGIPHLHTLHLHGNLLHDVHDLDVLHRLKVLRKLSLHGA